MDWFSDLLANFQDPEFLIVQGLGALGFVFYIASFQILSPRRTILVQSMAHPFYMLHFWGLGFPYLAFLGLMAALRDVTSALLDNPRLHRYLLVGNMVVLYVAAFFLASTTGDIMGLVGSTASTISQFFRRNFYVYRWLMMAHNSFWLATYIYAGSIPGAIVMIGITGSNMLGIVRYWLQERSG